MPVLTPTDIDELVEIMSAAQADGTRLELRGGGSKAGVGADRDATVVDMRGLAGVADYDPPELVLTVRAGTPLAEVEALVAGQGQMLAFDPWDHGPLFGKPAGAATIGGIVAAGVSGPRRLTRGAARDHLLGFTAVSGRGERFVAGGKVVKNVTGFDLPKLMAGSWGRLAALTELTLKVVPRPPASMTLVLAGLDCDRARAAMAAAMRSRAEVAAAAHLPGEGGTPARTLLRLEGFERSLPARIAALTDALADQGRASPLPPDEAARLWDSIRRAAPLDDAPVLWRLSLPPSGCTLAVETLAPLGARWLLDWAGGLLWLACDDAAAVRAAAERAGGHAMLVRAPAAMRAAIPAQHPRPAPLAAAEARMRRAFDPLGLFETGRFLDLDDADPLHA